MVVIERHVDEKQVSETAHKHQGGHAGHDAQGQQYGRQYARCRQCIELRMRIGIDESEVRIVEHVG